MSFAPISRCLRLLALFGIMNMVCGAGQAATDTTPSPPARVIVKLKSSSSLLQDSSGKVTINSSSGRMQALGKRLGLNLADGRMLSSRTQVAMASGMSSEALATRLAAQSDVEYAVVDHLRHRMSATAPNDPLYASQWYLPSTAVSGINAPGAWTTMQSVTTQSVVVAVVDTGVRFEHPDLSGQLLSGYNMISNAVMAGNSVGRSSDASDLGDYLTPAEILANHSLFSDCDVSDSSWHGTVVSGIIGATADNSIGVAGIAGSVVKILPVRVLGKCGGYDSDILAGMLWAAGISVSGVPDNTTPAKVINLSLGGTGTCTQAYVEAITQITAKGAVIVASAGNDSTSAGVPANCSGVIGVAAVTHDGARTDYSSYGSSVTISAPGGDCGSGAGCQYPIFSTFNTGTQGPVASSYTSASDAEIGTSFSAPMVSATAALMLSVNPSLSPANLTALLRNSARAFPALSGLQSCATLPSGSYVSCNCTNTTCGAGMLDTSAAVSAALAAPSTPVAHITYSPSSPTAGQTITLSASGSTASTGATISSYNWTLLDGGGIVTGLSSATGSTVTASASAAGTFQVQLTANDSLGQSDTTTLTITVASGNSGNNSSGGGGGGGALDGAMLGLFAASLFGALARRRMH